MIKVQNDILSALDAGSSAILLMLDLSAAFDTIDHDILLSRLCNVYGITGNALDWFRSYLTGRIQRVVIENAVSGDQELGFGVPQGSVLGPMIYCMYTKPVSDIIQRHVVVYPLPWPLLVGGVRCSRLWSTSQLLRPSGQQCSHSGGVCSQIQGRQCGAYVGAVEEMMCVVCVDVTEGA